MNLPLILLQASALTEGARRMQATDPHGWTLTLIAVTVVFSALAILFIAFTVVGRISQTIEAKQSSPKPKKASRKATGKQTPDGQTAAAIALALEAEAGGEIPVAIATALAMHLAGGVHDSEPYKITIRRAPSAWDAPALRFRKKPVR